MCKRPNKNVPFNLITHIFTVANAFVRFSSLYTARPPISSTTAFLHHLITWTDKENYIFNILQAFAYIVGHGMRAENIKVNRCLLMPSCASCVRCGVGGEWKQEAKWIVVLTFWYLWHYFDGALSRLQFIGWHFDSNTIAYSLPCCADNIVTTIGSSIFVCVWATHDSSQRTLHDIKCGKLLKYQIDAQREN